MLTRIQIENLAIVESASAGFGSGLNSITGETGSGKSVLIGALELALGARGSADAVRSGARTALAEAHFEGPFGDEVVALVADLGVEWEPGEPLVLRREISSSQGRSRCFVSGQMVGVADLRRLGELLADLHGQHEHQSLFRASAQRAALDAFGGNETLVAEYRRRYAEFSELRRRKESLDSAAADYERRLDYLEFQIGEIEQVAPREGELAELEIEESRLAHAEQLARAADAAYRLLYEGDGDSGPNVVDSLGEIARSLQTICRLDPSCEGMATRLGELEALADDLAREIRAYGDRCEPDPERLEETVSRIDSIRKLLRKHGAEDETTLLEMLARLHDEADRMRLDESEREGIEQRLQAARAELGRAGDALFAARSAAADRFAEEIMRTLAEVAMERAVFRVSVQRADDFGPDGADRVEFLLEANPGEGIRPLRDTASGGELSRAMLAIKAALARRDSIPTLVFDEIDTGISGETAARVGRLLERLGGSHQILCITHHASIAARGARHLSVRKTVARGRTSISTLELEGEARLEELARMMGGDPRSDAGKSLARTLVAA